MSDCLVLDEWLLHDLRGENSRQAQRETIEFLERLRERCDHIAVLRGSPWMQKAYDLMAQSEVRVRPLSKFLHLAILQDSKKCRFFDPGVLPIEEKLAAKVPADDLYLVECYFAAGAKAIITTDQVLADSVRSVSDTTVNVRLRPEFLSDYMAASGPRKS